MPPTWDYQKPYPLGPMVGPKLPHASYPPDAAPGHTPTKDSDAHKAYKRALCRLGRWGTWDPTKWDDSFSNQFSHGKTGGNVVDSGVAGFQRQMKISPSGWMGAATYDKLRASRIPQGLPNAGQPAFDAVCINLLNNATVNFDPPKPELLRISALQEAKKWLGTKEAPFGSNICKFSSWYGMYGPWCFMFATYCYVTAAQARGIDCPTFVRGSYYAFVPYGVNDARAGKRGLSVTKDPRPGDLVFYNWNADDIFDHVGIFEAGNASAWTAIEGNTSTSSNSNGGEVMRRDRKAGIPGLVFARVAGA